MPGAIYRFDIGSLPGVVYISFYQPKIFLVARRANVRVAAANVLFTNFLPVALDGWLGKTLINNNLTKLQVITE